MPLGGDGHVQRWSDTEKGYAPSDLPGGSSLFLSSTYASLAAAVTAIGSTPCRFQVISAAFTNGSPCTVPVTMEIEFIGPGALNIVSGHTVTILSDTSNWPIRQLFTGTGTISFSGNTSVGDIYAAWWGEDPAASDNAPFLISTFAAATTAGGGCVRSGKGIYVVGAKVTVPSQTRWKCEGKGATTIKRKSGYTGDLIWLGPGTGSGKGVVLEAVTVHGNYPAVSGTTGADIVLASPGATTYNIELINPAYIGIEVSSTAPNWRVLRSIITGNGVAASGSSNIGIWCADHTIIGGLIQGNTITNWTVNAIFGGAFGLIISDNYFAGNHVQTSPVGGGQIAAGDALGTMTVIDNYFGAGGGTSTYGLEVDNCPWTISNNTIVGQQAAGIRLAGGSGHRLTANNVSGSGGNDFESILPNSAWQGSDNTPISMNQSLALTVLGLGVNLPTSYNAGDTATFISPSDSPTNISLVKGGIANPQGLHFGVNQASLYSEIQAAQDLVATNSLILNRQGGNVGIGTAVPGDKLEVSASGTQGVRITNTGNLATDFSPLRFFQGGAEKATIFTNQENLFIRRSSSGNIIIGDNGGNVGIGTATFPSGSTFNIANTFRTQSNDYASQATGWAIGGDGSADFRYLYTDELHAKAFIADIEFALAGGQIIAKSVSKVAANFTLPAAGASASLTVEEFAGSTAHVFVDGDLVWLRQTTRGADTSLTIASAYGSVTYVSRTAASNTTPSYQTYTFARPVTNGGSASGTINQGTIVIDLGTTANKWGYYEVNAVDGANAVNSPYAQIVTSSGTGGPAVQANRTVRTRIGNLNGITGVVEYGLYAGNVVDGTTLASTHRYIRLTDTNFELNNLDLAVYNAGSKTVSITASEGSLRLGSNVSAVSTTAIVATGTAITYNSESLVASSILLGDNSSGKANVLASGGSVKIRRGTTDYISLTATDAQFANVINMSGANAAIATGLTATIPTSASAGTGLWLDRTGLYGLLSGVVQAKFDATTGAISGGAGAATLDNSGFWLTVGGIGTGHSVSWKDSGTTVGSISTGYGSNITSALWAADGKSGDTGGQSGIELRARNDVSTGLHFSLIALGSLAGNNGVANLYKDAGLGTFTGFGIGTSATPNAMLDVRGGMVVGTSNPTGGDLGAGKVNVTGGFYINGVAVGGGGSTSPLTTKGDIWAYSTVDARLPVGTNGQVLSSDSTQTTGLKWISNSATLAIGSSITSGTSGSLLYVNSSVQLAQDHANLQYDDSAHQLSVKKLVLGSYAGSNDAPSNGFIVSGNVGIGATSPASKLDVNGGVTIGSYAGTNAAPSNGMIVSGNVGIGTSSPSNRLHVYTTTSADGLSIDGTTYPSIILRNAGTIKAYAPALSTAAGGFFANSATNDLIYRAEQNGRILFGVDNGAGTANAIMILSAGMQGGVPAGGDKGVGTFNLAGVYYANGTAGVSAGSFSAITAITSSNGIVTQLTGTSDERLKENISNFTDGLKALSLIQPIRYRWNKEGRKVIDSDLEWVGFSAQNIQRVIPEAVGVEQWKDGSKWLTLADRPILAATVNAIKELSAKLEAADKRISELEGMVN